MRLFIAIELNDQIKSVLSSIQNDLKRYMTKGNPTSTDNFHITLRFIGEVNEEEAEKLKKVVNEAAAQTKPFTLYLSELGHFPRKNKEIIWAGVKGQMEELFKLKDKLESELEAAGFSKEERDYTPHISLVRQAVLERGYDEVKEELTVPEDEITVESIALMESKRIDDELVYRAIHEKTME